MLDHVLGGQDGDRGTGASPAGERPVFTDGLDVPFVAVLDPARVGSGDSQVAVVVAGDDDVADADLRAVGEGDLTLGGNLTGGDAVPAGAGVEVSDGLGVGGEQQAGPAGGGVG